MEQAAKTKLEITGQESITEGSAHGSTPLNSKVDVEVDVQVKSAQQVQQSTLGNTASEDSAAEEGQVVPAGQSVEMEKAASREVPMKEDSPIACSAPLETDKIKTKVPRLEATMVSPGHPKTSQVQEGSGAFMVPTAKQEEETKQQIAVQESSVVGGQLVQEESHADEVQTTDRQETIMEDLALQATMHPPTKLEEEVGDLKEETAGFYKKVAHEARPLGSSAVESPEVQQKFSSNLVQPEEVEEDTTRDSALTMTEPPKDQGQAGEVKGNNTKALDLGGTMYGVQGEESSGYREQTPCQEEERVTKDVSVQGIRGEFNSYEDVTTGDSLLTMMEPPEVQEMKGSATRALDLEGTVQGVQGEESNSYWEQSACQEEERVIKDASLQGVQGKLSSSEKVTMADSSLAVMGCPELQAPSDEMKGSVTRALDLGGIIMQGVQGEGSNSYGEQTACQEEESVTENASLQGVQGKFSSSEGIATGDSSLTVMEPAEVQRQPGEMTGIARQAVDLGGTMEAIQGEESNDLGEQTECQEKKNAIEHIALKDVAVQPRNVQGELHKAEVQETDLKDKFIVRETDLGSATVEHPDVADEVSVSLVQREVVEELTRDLALNGTMKEPLVQADTPKDGCASSLMEKIAVQEAKIMELKREVSSKDVTIEALKEEVASKEITIEALNIASQESTSEMLNEMVVSHESAIEEMKEQVAAKEKTIAVLEEKILPKGTIIESVEEKVAGQESTIVALKEKVAGQESIIEVLKEKVAGQESTIEALIREMTSCKASEEQARKNSEALEHQFSDLNGKQQSTAVKLRDVSLQYYKELKAKEVIIAAMKRHEAHILRLQGQLDAVTDERGALEATCGDLDRQLIEANDMCAALEDKISKFNLKLKKTDMLLSQALSEKSELQEKLKATEELLATGMVGGTSREMDLKFEELGRLATASDEKVRAQLVMAKLKLVSLQQRNENLEQQLRQVEKKNNEKLLEIEELNKKTAELTSLTETIEEEKELSKSQFVEFENEKRHLECSLDMSMKRNVELEEEVKGLVHKIAGQESHARAMQEMEELVMISDSKRMEAENRVTELELQVEATRGQVWQLEEAVHVEHSQYMNAQEELSKYHGNEEKLSVELMCCHEKLVNLKHDLQVELEKKSELAELLSEETNKLKEKENELQCTKKELKESTIKEGELLESLNSAESMYIILEAQLQKELALISERDSKIEEMQKKLETVENEEHENVTSLKAELEVSTIAQAALQDTINELKAKAQEMESKVEQELKEEEELTKRNSELTHEHELDRARVNELEQKLSSARTEIEAVEKAIALLHDQNSQGLELLAIAQSQVQEFEVKLEETTIRLQESESEAQVLNEKLKETLSVLSQKNFDVEELQNRVTDLENDREEVAEAAAKVALLTMDLEESENVKASLEQQINELNIKVQELESEAEQSFLQNEMMAEANAKLSKQLDFQKTKFSDLQQLLDSIKGEHGPAVVERIALYEVDSREKDLEYKLQEAMETLKKRDSAAKKLNERLEQALAKISQKDCEAKELQEKFMSAKEQVAFHQEKESKAVEGMKSVKNELMASTIRRASLEKIISELRNKVSLAESQVEELVAEKEAMDEINSKMRSELEMQQAKVDKLQLILASRSAERETTEVTKGEHSIVKEFHEPHATEAHPGVQEASEVKDDDGSEEIQKLKALISELKEQLEEYKVENSLANQLESSIVEDEVTLAMKAKILELEEELERVEESYRNKMNKWRSDFAGEEEEASIKLESTCELDEKDALLEQLALLQKELHLAQMTLAEQEKEGEKKVSLFNANIEDMKKKLSQATELEEKVANLQHELQLSNGKDPHQEVKVIDTENKGKVEEKSRALAPVATVPLKRKGKKRGHATTVHTPPSPTASPVATDTSTTTRRRSLFKKAFIFIFGITVIVLLSMIGVIIYDQYCR